jgi:hypothetical protein
MSPWPDRLVLLALAGAVALCFALAMLAARMAPDRELPLLWREDPPPLTLLLGR